MSREEGNNRGLRRREGWMGRRRGIGSVEGGGLGGGAVVWERHSWEMRNANPPPLLPPSFSLSVPPPYTHTYGTHIQTHTIPISLSSPQERWGGGSGGVGGRRGGEWRKGRGRGNRKRWRRGQIGALKFMVPFFLFSLLKINSVYYEWVEQWTTVVPGGQRDREEEEEEEKSKGGRGKDVEGETLLR